MRILIIDPAFEYSTLAVAEAYYDAFVKLGYETMEYELMPTFAMLKNSGHQFINWNEMTEIISSPIINTVIQDKIDFMLVIHGVHMNTAVVDCIRAIGCKTGIILTDEPQQTEVSKVWSRHYDYVFTNDRNTLTRHDNCSFLPTASNPDIFHPGEVDRFYKSDILVGGSFYRERKEFMENEELYECLKKYDVKCVGARKFNIDCCDPRFKWFGPRKIHIDEMASFVRGTKICIDIPRNELEDSVFPGGNFLGIKASNLSPRIYEAGLSKTLCLTDKSRNDIKDLFNGGIHQTYKSVTSLCEYIDYYMENEIIRESIVDEHYDFCSKYHTYVNRVKRIEQVVGLRPSKKEIETTNMRSKIVSEKFDALWGLNIKKIHENKLYIAETNLRLLKDTVVDGIGALVSNGVSLETTGVDLKRFQSGDIFCVNQAGMYIKEQLDVDSDNLILIHPEDDVYHRTVERMKPEDIEGRNLYCSTVVSWECPVKWVEHKGNLKFFTTGLAGPKKIATAIEDYPMIGAGLTVIYNGLAVMHYMGYREIHLYGCDFAYINNRRYAWQNYDYEDLIKMNPYLTKSISGSPVFTDSTLAKSIDCCRKFVEACSETGFVVHGDGLFTKEYNKNIRNEHWQ